MKKQVLFAVLDWGLGHLTRSITLMRELQKRQVDIHFCGTKSQYQFLIQEGVEVIFHEVPCSQISYSTKKGFFNYVSITRSIFSQYKRDQEIVKKLESKFNYSAIFSDHRYGFRSHKTKSIIICHQLNLVTPFLLGMVNAIHKTILNRFQEVWCPDFSDNRLAGTLSTNKKKLNVKYAGNLSRLKAIQKGQQSDDRKKILVVLSGPEPQRTDFFQRLIPYLNALSETFEIEVLSGGSEYPVISSNQSFKIHQNAQRKKFLSLFSESVVVISRSGYTTIMDVFKLNKKAVLIPTPYQYEQEYLGEFHCKNPSIEILHESEIQRLEGKVKCLIFEQKKEETSSEISSSNNALEKLLDELLG